MIFINEFISLKGYLDVFSLIFKKKNTFLGFFKKNVFDY